MLRHASYRRAPPPAAAYESPTIRPHASFGYSARAWATIASARSRGRHAAAGPGCALPLEELTTSSPRPRSRPPSRRGRARTCRRTGTSSPPSGSSATIVPASMRFASRAAATSTAPHDGPANTPSLNTRSRSAATASRFDTRYFASSTRRIEDLGDEALLERPQALDVLARQRLRGDDPHARPPLAEVPPGAHQRPRRPEARHEHVDLRAVREDLRPGRLVVRLRVRRVAVLVGHDEPRVGRGDLLGHRDRAVGALRARRVDDLRAEQRRDLPPLRS